MSEMAMPAAGEPGGPAAAGAAGAVLARAVFEPSALEVAPALLGCVLRTDSPDGPVAALITEVEAYTGGSDPASHAYRGKTPRNAVMFGPPGHAYVYFTYGMHFCVNLVCEPEGNVSAILLRAGRIVEGAALAAARRWPRVAAGEAIAGGRARAERELAGGPARLCQALGIDRALNGADACDPGSPLRVLAGPGGAAASGEIRSGPRIGISQAADRPWRYWLAGEGSVTPYKKFTPRRGRPVSVTGGGPGGGKLHR